MTSSVTSVAVTTPPTIGEPLTFDIAGVPTKTACVLMFGASRTLIDLSLNGAPGCFIHTDFVIQVGLTTTPGTPSKSDGTLTLPLPIPNDNSLRGFFVRSQLLVADANSRRPLQAIFTNGLGITIQ